MPLAPNQITTVEIIVFGTISSAGSNARNTVNIFHYTTPPTSTAKTHQAVNDIFQSQCVPSLTNCLNNRWTQQHNTVRFIDDATDAAVTFAESAVGLVTGDSMPMICAAYMLLRTGLRGKHFRGSKHFGPLSESDTTKPSDDVFNAAMLALWENAAGQLIMNMNDANGNLWKPCVFSRQLSQVKVNPTTIVVNNITQILVKKSIGRLRRREAKSVY